MRVVIPKACTGVASGWGSERMVESEHVNHYNISCVQTKVAAANEATAAAHREADLRQRAADDRAAFKNAAHEARQVLTGRISLHNQRCVIYVRTLSTLTP